MKQKRFYINTMGCQMNVYDSSRMAAALAQQQYKPVTDYRKADLVIVNTCTIRAKARQKAMSFVGRLEAEKRKDPDMIVAVAGCVAQQEGEGILDTFPQVDIVLGTQAVGRLPRLIDAVERDGIRRVDIAMSDAVVETDYPRGRVDQDVSDYVTIMKGCDNFCTYCVVPYVRGREASRLPENIVNEVKALVADGVREVILLGQNVNSYGNKENFGSFADLLSRINDVEGLMRLRFTTSHPKDLSDDLIEAFGRLDKLTNHFHLPVQAGSDRILRRMNRKYTRQSYLEKISRLREVRPDMAITTDIIAGFPGETNVDFRQTMTLLEEVQFDNIFAFMYSDRVLAPASRFKDKVPMPEKKRRLAALLERQKAISFSKNQRRVGNTETVLVEGLSKHALRKNKTEKAGENDQWSGRTTTNKVVNFYVDLDFAESQPVKSGSLVSVRIDDAFAYSLSGRATHILHDFKQTRGNVNAA